jgi:hypothetical protein
MSFTLSAMTSQNNESDPIKMKGERIYRPVELYTREQAEEAIRSDDIATLVYVAFSIGMRGSDWKYAQDLCVRLADHPHKTVRGNAILGLEYVARFQGRLEKHIAKPVLLRALKDPELEVVERARDAIEVINYSLGWRIGMRRVHPAKKVRNEETKMSNDFYNPLVEAAGRIAGDYGVSISDVVGLLVLVDNDEARVKQALDESLKAEGADARIGADRGFDLVAHARTLLQRANQDDK